MSLGMPKNKLFFVSVEQCSLFVPLALYFILILAALLLYVPLHSHEKRGVTVFGRMSYDSFSDSKYNFQRNSRDSKALDKFNKNKLLTPPELLESIFYK